MKAGGRREAGDDGQGAPRLLHVIMGGRRLKGVHAAFPMYSESDEEVPGRLHTCSPL